MGEPAFVFARAGPDDLDALVALRIAAMRENLERVGRFSPERARQWFIDGFRPDCTRWIEVAGELAGCVAVGEAADGDLWLDHFYLFPAHQGRGLGEAVIRRLMAEADGAGKAVRLNVLVDSPANRFYLRHGFVETGREGVDIHYRRPAAREVST